MTAVEIAVQGPAGARVARAAGADRVELCAALGVTGGVTPGPGLLDAVVAVGIDVHVLVRPRPGGFVHDDDEAAVLLAEIAHVARAGATGVVVGALTADGAVDQRLTERLVAAAGGLEVTFHRAFDVVERRSAALAQLADLGVTRVLTSAGAARAVDGVAELAHLVGLGTGVQVMAGGGVRPADVPALVRAGVHAVHLSARGSLPDRGRAGPGGGPGVPLEVTDADVVRAAVEAARGADAAGRLG